MYLKPAGVTNNSIEASATTYEGQQEFIMDYITNAYLDPTIVLGLEGPHLGMHTQSSGIVLEPVLRDSQLGALTELNVNTGGF